MKDCLLRVTLCVVGNFASGVVLNRGANCYHAGVLQPGACEPVLIAVKLVEVAAMLRSFWLWAAAGVLFFPLASRSERLPETALDTSPVAQQVAQWIEQLDGAGFIERQAASQQLEEAGLAALGPLQVAAVSASREASTRALAILKRHLLSSDENLKLAARDILLRLAQSDDASAAQRARDALSPPKESSGATPVGFQPAMMPPNNNFGGRFNGNFGAIFAGPGGFRKVGIEDINGRKKFTLDERERLVTIETAPGGRIDAEVTDKRSGVKRTIEAKDADDLKRKDRELGQLFDQYFGPGQQRLGAPPPALPLGFAPPMPAVAPAGSVNRQLESVDLLIERYKQRLPTDPLAQRMIDLLEQSKQRYKEMLPAGDTKRVVR